MDEELPVVPEDSDPHDPLEWITTHGPVRFLAYSGKEKCEDCKHLILDEIFGKQRFDNPVGLARVATSKRVQNGTEVLLCSPHKHSRIQRGEGNG